MRLQSESDVRCQLGLHADSMRGRPHLIKGDRAVSQSAQTRCDRHTFHVSWCLLLCGETITHHNVKMIQT